MFAVTVPDTVTLPLTGCVACQNVPVTATLPVIVVDVSDTGTGVARSWASVSGPETGTAAARSCASVSGPETATVPTTEVGSGFAPDTSTATPSAPHDSLMRGYWTPPMSSEAKVSPPLPGLVAKLSDTGLPIRRGGCSPPARRG